MDLEAAAFSTHVGVFPSRRARRPSPARLPHARGGVSHVQSLYCEPAPSSPRTWGCFLPLRLPPYAGRVFPTHVGVFPSVLQCLMREASLPHARGGVSGGAPTMKNYNESSPRTWGCFRFLSSIRRTEGVIPTHVGVFPQLFRNRAAAESLPHARGGVSAPGSIWKSIRPVFPTHVGVFPRLSAEALPPCCLPHARGGVSRTPTETMTGKKSSPRTWGCFHVPSGAGVAGIVFPTHVGVFPSSIC